MNNDQLTKIKQYNAERLSNSEIARRLNVVPYTITYNLKKMGLFSSFRGGNIKKIGDGELIKIKQYNAEGWFNTEIAQQLDVCTPTVAYHLKKMGLSSPLCVKSLERVGNNKARCSRCNKVKDISKFQFGRKGQQHEYKFSYCNKCRNKQTHRNVNFSIEKFLQNKFITSIKPNCKRKNIPISIDAQYLIDLYKKQKGACFYTGHTLSWGHGEGSNYKSQLSIDRVVSELGYIKNNVVLCTRRINTVKNNLTLKEIRQWLPSWYQKLQALPQFEMLKKASGDF